MARTAFTASKSSSNGAVPWLLLLFRPLVNVVVVVLLLSCSSSFVVHGFVPAAELVPIRAPAARERTVSTNIASEIVRVRRSLQTASARQSNRRIGNRYYYHSRPAASPGNKNSVVPLRLAPASSDLVDDDDAESSSSAAFALDPASEQVATLLCDQLELTDRQFGLILELTACVCEWNTKINLISRRDCRPDTVLGRHILPCLATGGSAGLSLLFQKSAASGGARAVRVMDVGTGGGFPGLPLSIQFADSAAFVLADSVGKKIAAVRDMAQQLQLSNVETYHGRVEDYFGSTVAPTTTERFDVVTGRSVTALPQFCAWVQHLLKPDTGHLVYWTGGSVDPHLLEQAVHNVALQELMPNDWRDDNDKRILVFTAATVRKIARESGIVVVPTRPARSSKTTSSNQPPKRRVKGAWKKRSADEPRQRGYENFKRYSSFSSSSTSSENRNDGE